MVEWLKVGRQLGRSQLNTVAEHYLTSFSATRSPPVLLNGHAEWYR